MPSFDDPTLIRRPDRERLCAALVDARSRTLRTFAAYERALRSAGLQVPYSPEVNPPLWELGHVGWFQEYWIGRNPERLRGVAADPDVARSASALSNADGLYDGCTTRAGSSTRRAGACHCPTLPKRVPTWDARWSRHCGSWRDRRARPKVRCISPG